jgi:hypothetical protein
MVAGEREVMMARETIPGETIRLLVLREVAEVVEVAEVAEEVTMTTKITITAGKIRVINIK